MLLVKDLLMANSGGDFPTDPVRFDYTGSVQTYTVPKGCKKIHVDAVGAAGGYMASTAGANGGRVECDLIVASSQILYIYIGGVGTTAPDGGYGTPVPGTYAGGWNGGGNSRVSPGDTPIGSGAGGGATDIRTVPATSGSWYITNHSSWYTDSSLLSRLVVAGAGAGGGGGSSGAGAGGNLIGQSNGDGKQIVTGGTQTEPGYYYYVSDPNKKYNFGYFGAGSSLDFSDLYVGYGGGAGSGWYGGGSNQNFAAGGSSYTHSTLCSNVVHTQGYSSATGNGWLIITPLK